MTGTQIYYREGAHGAWSPRGQRQQISEWGVWELLRLPGGSVRGQGHCWGRDPAGMDLHGPGGLWFVPTAPFLPAVSVLWDMPHPIRGAPEARPGAGDKDGAQTATKQEGQSPNRKPRFASDSRSLTILPLCCCFFPPKPARSHRALTLPRPPSTMRPPRWPSPSRATSSAPRHHPSGRVSLTGGCRQLRRLAGHDEGLEDLCTKLRARLGAVGITGWPSGCHQPDVPGGPQTDHPKAPQWM